MTRFKLAGAAALLLAFSLPLALASPAAADDGHPKKHVRHHYRIVEDPDAPPKGLTVENATRWGYGQGYGAAHTGFGGLYGDGYYPGNVYYAPEVTKRQPKG
jgi:hypothetical protein